jgi:ferrous iron transport protein B
MAEQRKKLKVAITGNPNCGKTVLFNELTGGRQHVGNWPGVTVEQRSGTHRVDGHELEIIDLPGTYSLSPLTLDQLVARDYVLSDEPDVIINIVDASNLERNLFLTSQLLELELPLVIALNMMDVVEVRGDKIDTEQLSRLLGCPVVPIVATKRRNLDGLIESVVAVAEGKTKHKPVRVNYGRDLEKSIAVVKGYLTEHEGFDFEGPPRWQAIRLLERDPEYLKKLDKVEGGEELKELVATEYARMESLLGEEPENHFNEAAYGFAAGAIRETIRRNALGQAKTTEKIDRVLTHRIWGLPIFGLLMWLTFEVTFTLGAPFMGWIEEGFGWLAGLAASVIPEGLLQSLIVDGIIGGVGGVLVFVPNILFLFLMISILEDSGYMARAAFVMDRFMHKLGLHGKSFIPMVIGFGCTVPAVMAARTLENPKDRLVTILTVPLMSCGARLPVYILLAGAFFPAAYAGTIIFSIYLLGIVLAVVMAKLLRSTVLKGDRDPFVMELPSYHIPTVKAVLFHASQRAWLYMRKAGTIILFAMVIIWALTIFPGEPEDPAFFEELRLTAGETFLDTQEDIAFGLGLSYVVEDFAPTGEAPYVPWLAENDELLALTEGIGNAHEDFNAIVEDGELEEGSADYTTAERGLADSLATLSTSEETPYSAALAVSGETLYSAAERLYEAQSLYSTELTMISAAEESARLKITPLGYIGRGLSYVFYPLGFDWKISSALVAGFAAKEIVVGTLGILYSIGEVDESSTELQERINTELNEQSNGGGWLTALTLMVFVLIYVPCVAVLAVIKRETGSWKWVGFSILYLTGLAYAVAGLTRLIGSLWL